MIRKSILCCLYLACSISFSAFAQQNKPAFSRMDVFELEWVTDPQISPDGSRVVYERRGMDIMKDGKTSRLWLMSADGQQHYKLTDQDINESSPVWSPDGSRIAFTSSTKGNGLEIFVYWLAQNRLARLTQLESSPSGMSWSPDGKHLAFSMKVPAKQPTLVIPPAKPEGAEWADHPRVTTRLKHESDGSGYVEPGFRNHPTHA